MALLGESRERERDRKRDRERELTLYGTARLRGKFLNQKAMASLGHVE